MGKSSGLLAIPLRSRAEIVGIENDVRLTHNAVPSKQVPQQLGLLTH